MVCPVASYLIQAVNRPDLQNSVEPLTDSQKKKAESNESPFLKANNVQNRTHWLGLI